MILSSNLTWVLYSLWTVAMISAACGDCCKCRSLKSGIAVPALSALYLPHRCLCPALALRWQALQQYVVTLQALQLYKRRECVTLSQCSHMRKFCTCATLSQGRAILRLSKNPRHGIREQAGPLHRTHSVSRYL